MRLIQVWAVLLLASCVGLNEKATTAPYDIVQDLLEPVGERLEVWTAEDAPVWASWDALQAWPVGVPYDITPATQEWVGDVCQEHDFYVPAWGQDEFEIKVWFRSTDELRAWFEIEG